MATILILHAADRPNDKNELNWHEFRTVPTNSLGAPLLSELIGGHLERMVPTDESKGYTVFWNEDGLNLDLRQNDLASLLLEHTQFRHGVLYLNTAPIVGTVVITGSSKRDIVGLKAEQQAYLAKKISKVIAQWNEESGSE